LWPTASGARHGYDAREHGRPPRAPGTATLPVNNCPYRAVSRAHRGPCGSAELWRIDALEDMQWQTLKEAPAKDKWECNDCALPVAIPRVALRSETSVGSRGEAWRGGRRAASRRGAGRRGFPGTEQLEQAGFRMRNQKMKARFVEPMLLEHSANLPQGQTWSYERKLDGYRL
jgi:hypothetical protein